ncbi:MAG: hypothetical protein QG635_1598, partial [Bacteroidota bacterium]|nr:hypothetical protein [Bacteroidota bacterium]
INFSNQGMSANGGKFVRGKLLFLIDTNNNPVFCIPAGHEGIINFGDNFELTLNYTKNCGFIFVKYSPEGKCLEVKKVVSESIVNLNSFFTDKDGYLYLSGVSCGQFDFGNGLNFKKGENSFFLVKYSPDWDSRLLVSMKMLNNSEYLTTENILDKDKNVYFYTILEQGLKFPNDTLIAATSTNTKMVFFKFDSSGNFKWVKGTNGASFINKFGPNKYNIWYGPHLMQIHDDNIYIINSVKGDIVLDENQGIELHTGNKSIAFIANYNTDGEIVWLKQLICNKSSNFISSSLSETRYMVLGSVSDTGVYDNSNIIYKTDGSYFISELSLDGNMLWTKQFKNIPFFLNYNTFFYNFKNNVYFGGLFIDSIKLDNNYQLKANDSIGLFIAKYSNLCSEHSYNYNDFTSMNNININGVAKQLDSALRLTSTEKNTSGAAWRSDPIPVKNGFKTEFTFRMSEGWNDFGDGSLPGADGIAFVIQNSSNDAVGSDGGGIGYSGIPNSLAIEFDTYKNDFDLSDPDGNHVAVFSSGAAANTSDHSSNDNLATNSNILTLRADSTIYHAKVDYNIDPGKLRVWLDTTREFLNPVIVLDSIKLEKLINLKDGDKAFVGFTSSTGNSYENHDILSWWFCPIAGDSITDVEEENMNLENNCELTIIPNPAADFIHVSGIEPSEIVCIYSIEGIKIYDGRNNGRIDVSTLSKGIYIIKVRNKYMKFVKI